MRVPAGECFFGGSPRDKFVTSIEQPRQRLRIEQDFGIGRFPVTERELSLLLGSDPDERTADLPAVRIDYETANAFANSLSDRLGRPLRLPTEMEWEFAARGGKDGLFPLGNSIDPSLANYLHGEDGERVGPGRRTEMGRYPSNAYGLYDMAGNVAEWTSTHWRPDTGAAIACSSGSESPDHLRRRTIRGGGWDSLPRMLRCSFRDWAPESARFDNLGFRLALDLTETSWN